MVEGNTREALFPEKAKVLFKAAPYKVFRGGRGSSKTWSFGRALLLLGSRTKLFILCARDIQKSIKDSVHKLLADQVIEMGLGWFYKIGTNEIVGLNGTKFVFHGIRNNILSIKSIEAIDICAVFEATPVSFNSWEVLLPTIRRDPPFGPFGLGSEVWVEFNPELATDETYKRWVINPPSPAVHITSDRELEEALKNWDNPTCVVVEMNWRDNPWFPALLMRQMLEMKERDYESYLTVWEGKTRKSLEGAIYAKEIAAATLAGRISPQVAHMRGLPVDVSFDLGKQDMCCMWFWQQVGMEHHAIDYYGNTGFDLAHYIEQMQQRKYAYRTIYLPHDADHDRLGMPLSIAKQVRAVFPGDGRVKVVPRIPNISLGINAVRNLWPRIRINEHACGDGLLGLQHYRYGVNKESGQRTAEPLHDWASNPADGFRTYVEALRETVKKPTPPVQGPRRVLTGGSGQSWLKR